PEELQTQSNIYWIAPHGPLGTGNSSFAIADISHSISHVAVSTSSGGGGGFSGGGGFGGGGGGGGAW
ncbi:MAG TPA: hypothetical protein VFK89_08650, partial [Actinomycetota bacterium]|nr:hypothetical protein [Actinomycetota bacterium]